MRVKSLSPFPSRVFLVFDPENIISYLVFATTNRSKFLTGGPPSYQITVSIRIKFMNGYGKIKSIIDDVT